MLTMPQVQQSLNEEVRRLEILVRELRLLINGDPAAADGDGEIRSATVSEQYVGMKAGNAVYQYLASKGAPASQEELRKVLITRGAKMGKFPKRTIANVVAFGVKNKRLELNGDLVSLRKP